MVATGVINRALRGGVSITTTATTTTTRLSDINALLSSTIQTEHGASNVFPLDMPAVTSWGKTPTVLCIIVGVDFIVWDFGITTYKGRKSNKTSTSVYGSPRKWVCHNKCPICVGNQGVKLLFSLSVRLFFDGASAYI